MFCDCSRSSGNILSCIYLLMLIGYFSSLHSRTNSQQESVLLMHEQCEKKSNFTASLLSEFTWVFILWSAEHGQETTQREYFIRKTKENGKTFISRLRWFCLRSKSIECGENGTATINRVDIMNTLALWFLIKWMDPEKNSLTLRWFIQFGQRMENRNVCLLLQV